MTNCAPASQREPQKFADAMSKFPSGVTVTVTRDHCAKPVGFTASAFCSLSMQPPLIAVCLSAEANCYAAFLAAERFAVHILGNDHEQVAIRFATKDAEKFVGGEFTEHADGLPALRGAIVRLSCAVEAIYPGGDHAILVGRVHTTETDDGGPVVYFRRGFHTLSEPA